MLTAVPEEIRTLSIAKSITISASVETTFAAVLAELGPGSTMPDGSSLNLKLEPWPGGRWYRDLGHDTGHLWGHVQVIKPPTLLEICGPMFMSYPAASHVQYRLTKDGAQTKLSVIHRAIGLISSEHFEGVEKGWAHGIERIRQIAESR